MANIDENQKKNFLRTAEKGLFGGNGKRGASER
jgi:hypothetical protein